MNKLVIKELSKRKKSKCVCYHCRRPAENLIKIKIRLKAYVCEKCLLEFLKEISNES